MNRCRSDSIKIVNTAQFYSLAINKVIKRTPTQTCNTYQVHYTTEFLYKKGWNLMLGYVDVWVIDLYLKDKSGMAYIVKKQSKEYFVDILLMTYIVNTLKVRCAFDIWT